MNFKKAMVKLTKKSKSFYLNIIVALATVSVLLSSFFIWRFLHPAPEIPTSNLPYSNYMSATDRERILAELGATTSPPMSSKQQQKILKNLSASTSPAMTKEEQARILQELQK